MNYSEIKDISSVLSRLENDIKILKSPPVICGIFFTTEEMAGIENEIISLLEKQIVKYSNQLKICVK